MNEASHTISFLEVIRNPLADFFNNTREVTANDGPWRRKFIEMHPIGGVQSHKFRLDYDESVSQAELGNILHEFSLSGALDLNCSSGGHIG